MVELWGCVETEVERKEMPLAAQEIAGVSKVIDHVDLAPPGTRSPIVVRCYVAQAMKTVY